MFQLLTRVRAFLSLPASTSSVKGNLLLLFLLVALGVVIRVIPQPRLAQSPWSYLIESSLAPKKALGHKKWEVLGFAPYWTLQRLDNVDFSTLTTFAYFGIPIKPDGRFDRNHAGYTMMATERVQKIFAKANANNAKVVVTLTQMNNDIIEEFLDDPNAQRLVGYETVVLLTERNLDGVNIDFEYNGDPGAEYKNKFSQFIRRYTEYVHKSVPSSFVTVSVYASAVKESKLYDIRLLGQVCDGVLMMAYDFATTSAKKVMPTAPLGGYKEGKYWYDISTAVDDFLTQMPAHKLILGVPYYGYNYPVATPLPNTRTLTRTYRRAAYAQTYESVQTDLHGLNPDIRFLTSGWDEVGGVGWKAYKDERNTWRIIFSEDKKSLSKKYDFIKEKNLMGVGIWALGFDKGRPELWDLLSSKFGPKIAVNK